MFKMLRKSDDRNIAISNNLFSKYFASKKEKKLRYHEIW